MGLAKDNRARPGVSQVMEMAFHAPARMSSFVILSLVYIDAEPILCLSGDRLRIISTTISIGSRVMSSRCEVRHIMLHEDSSVFIHDVLSADLE